MFANRKDGLERTKNKLDDVITSVGDRIIEDYMEPREYAKVIEAYADLVSLRLDLSQ